MNRLVGKLDKSKPIIAVVGCSYSHWDDGECFLESYPALIAKNYPDYNVVDLSAPGSSNDSAYMRLFHFEHLTGYKINKVLFQLTHFGRELVFFDWRVKNFNLWKEGYYAKDNYVYTKGDFSDDVNLVTATIAFDHPWSERTRKLLSKHFKLKESMLTRFFITKFLNDESVWKLQKEIDLVNGHYGKNNVLLYSWHRNLDTTTKTARKDLKVPAMPDNYAGSVEEWIGFKRFNKLGVDDAPHYDGRGHQIVYKHLEPMIDSLLKN